MDSEEMGEKIHKLEMLEMDFLRKNGINPNYNEEMVSDLEDKCNAIDSASDNLSDLNRFVKSMRKSDLRTNIMDCIERMKLALC